MPAAGRLLIPKKVVSVTTQQPSTGERLAPKLGWFSIGLGVAQLLAHDRLSNLIGVRASEDSRMLQRVVGVREAMAGVGILTGRPAPWMWLGLPAT